MLKSTGIPIINHATKAMQNVGRSFMEEALKMSILRSYISTLELYWYFIQLGAHTRKYTYLDTYIINSVNITAFQKLISEQCLMLSANLYYTILTQKPLS